MLATVLMSGLEGSSLIYEMIHCMKMQKSATLPAVVLEDDSLFEECSHDNGPSTSSAHIISKGRYLAKS